MTCDQIHLGQCRVRKATVGAPAIVALFGLPICAAAMEVTPDATAPVQIATAYTGEGWRNVSGGVRRDGAYLENIDLIATIDAERALGWSNTTLLVSGLHNNGPTLSERIVGDIQTVSNIDTDGATRLYEAWVERAFEGGALKVGLIDLNSEVDVNETGALFINSSHGIGPDFSQVGENGPSIFPVTGLGVVMRWDYSGSVQARFAAFEGTVDSNSNGPVPTGASANPSPSSSMALGLPKAPRASMEGRSAIGVAVVRVMVMSSTFSAFSIPARRMPPTPLSSASKRGLSVLTCRS
ncbi:MAG: carbohydrate porin [Pseudomonadota bacterium]|nr:carbohydrate porin [Pseudomonadota bacterium]